MDPIQVVVIVRIGSFSKLYGPFENVTDADRWAEENIQNGHEIIKIHPVSHSVDRRPSTAKRRGDANVSVASSYRRDRFGKNTPFDPA
jgi:hypothetical protein